MSSVRDALKIYFSDIRDVSENVSSFSRNRRGQFYYISVVRNYIVSNEEENRLAVRYILDNYPARKYSFIVDAGNGKETESWSVRWGINFSPAAGKEFPAWIRRNVEYFHACDSLYTGFLRTTADDLRREELDYVFDFAARNGFEISGPLLGETVEIIPTESDPHILYRLSVPVRNKK